MVPPSHINPTILFKARWTFSAAQYHNDGPPKGPCSFDRAFVVEGRIGKAQG
jgi:hypothetical protein